MEIRTLSKDHLETIQNRTLPKNPQMFIFNALETREN
jgi:hypothetical protein